METFNVYNMNRSIDKLDAIYQELNKKGNAISASIILFYVGVMTLLHVEEIPYEILYISLSIGGGILLAIITLLSKTAIIRYQIANKYINEEVVRLYNYEHELQMEYKPRYKIGSEFNKSMGLFTRFSSVSNKYMIKLDESTRILFPTIQTNSGNTNQVHFQGIYVIFDQPGYTTFQARTHGKPHFKDHKFVREDQDNIRLFKLENEDRIRFNYRSVFNRLDGYKKVFIGSNKKAVHIAFTPFKPKFKANVVTHETFREYYHQFETLFHTVIQIKDIVLLVNT